VDPTAPGGYTKRALSLDVMRESYPAFVQNVSPRGVLPAIQHPTSTTLKNNHDADVVVVWDALVAADYIDAVFGRRKKRHDDHGKEQHLLLLQPTTDHDAHDRAWVQMWCNHCVRNIHPCFESAISLPDNDDDRACLLWNQCLDECRTLALEMSHDGPFFMGQRFTMVDVALAPLWQRILWVGSSHSKSQGLFPPHDDEPWFRRLHHVWWRACSARSSVAATLVSKPRLVAFYNSNNNNNGCWSNDQKNAEQHSAANDNNNNNDDDDNNDATSAIMAQPHPKDVGNVAAGK
jgi:glutathione S-transferase